MKMTDHLIKVRQENGKKQCGKISPFAKYIPGMLVGNVLLLKRLDSTRKNSVLWSCQCLCEKKTLLERTNNQLSRKDSILHCGCKKPNHAKNFKGLNEITGSYFYRIARQAKERNFCFEISLQDIWELYLKQNKLCALSKVNISFSNNTASLDRIDSSNGYTINNIQLVHKDINRMKVDYKQEYFIEVCKLIALNS